MYSGALMQEIPTGPGCYMRPIGNKTFKGEFMSQKSDGSSRWSFESQEWLYFQQNQTPFQTPNGNRIEISHFFKGGEKRIISDSKFLFLDGYAKCSQTGETWALEYKGWN